MLRGGSLADEFADEASPSPNPNPNPSPILILLIRVRRRIRVGGRTGNANAAGFRGHEAGAGDALDAHGRVEQVEAEVRCEVCR